MYVYFIQPREYIGTSVYKVGMSACSNLSRLRSYGSGTNYLCIFGVDNCTEVEHAIVDAFNMEFELDHGREYFRISNKDIAIKLFTTIVHDVKSVNNVIYDTINSNNIDMKHCDICDYTTSIIGHFNRHLATVKHLNNVRRHEEQQANAREQRKRFVCSRCDKRFPRTRDLQRHLHRKTPCVDIHANDNAGSVTNNITNNTVNWYTNIYAQGIEEVLYSKTTYEHISDEAINNAKREFNHGRLYNDNRDAEIRHRYIALATLIEATHWNVDYNKYRNMIVLSMFPQPFTRERVPAEVFILDVHNNEITWETQDVYQFRNMVLAMMENIQVAKQVDLSEMTVFFEETLNEDNIGLINAAIWCKYYSYMGAREGRNKCYKRPKLVELSDNNRINKQYAMLLKNEAQTSNGSLPVKFNSRFLLGS